MKTYPFLAALCSAIIIFFSCSNDENENGSTEAGSPVKINIKIEGATALRAMDPNSVDADNVVNDLIVFITKDDGSFDGLPRSFASTDIVGGVLPTITATSHATHAFIVCNTGPYNSTSIFNGVANIGQVGRRAMAVDGNPITTKNNVNKNVWMAGNGDIVSLGTETAGVPNYGATVQLEYIPAKIYVQVNNNMTNYNVTTGNTIIDGVMIVNGGAWTRFIKEGVGVPDYKPLRSDITSANNVPFYYNGIDITSTPYADFPVPVGGFTDFTVKSLMNRAHQFTAGETYDFSDVSTNGQPQQFYVFPDITSNLTYVTVYGRYSTTGAAALSTPNIFWPVSFGGQDGLLTEIKSGKKYLVTITLTGDAGAGSGGSPDPTEQVVNANVSINIVPAQWNVEIKTKIFE